MSALLRIFAHDRVATIDPRIYGSFVEHLGRCVYTGLYEPGHPTADAAGWRTDVLDLVRPLNVPIVRYPGGNFVSAYDWEDGVGPRSARPRRLDYAWSSTESNQVGTNEFMDWCKLAGTTPMMAVNLGTRGLDSARALLEYCNHPRNSKYADLRRQHGYADPHNVRVWCLGNEMDGPWQTGHKTALEYGRLAAETARAFRQYDPTLELVACGSSGPGMNTFPEWDREVLEHTYDSVDAISLHLYLGRYENSLADYLASAVTLDQQIKAIIATCDYVQARGRHKKPMALSFDEWNVWDMKKGTANPPGMTRWDEAPPQLEQIYTFADALLFGGMMLGLIRHAQRVRMACLAQLVNVIAPIMTRPDGTAWRQPTYWIFQHGSLHGRGELIETRLTGAPVTETKAHGASPDLDAVVTRNGDHLTVFALNRGAESHPLELRLDGTTRWKMVVHEILSANDLDATNSPESPMAVAPRDLPLTPVSADGRLELRLPAYSWHCIRLTAVI
jgi:alpha-L-arabinofuranosidase